MVEDAGDPAPARLRTLPRRTSILAEAERTTGVEVVSGEAQSLLRELGLDVIRTRVDLIHFPLIYHFYYYFYAESERASLPAAIRHLVRFVESGSRAEQPFAFVWPRRSSAPRSRTWPMCWLSVSSMPANEPAPVFREYAEDHLLPAQLTIRETGST